MTPNELYKRVPEKIVLAIEPASEFFGGGYLEGFYYNHVPEIDGQSKYNPSDRIKCYIYKDFDFDGRRFWRLAAIWFDDKPIMIVQNAGREGDDHSERFITNWEGYCEMVQHIMSLRIPDEFEQENLVDPDTDIEGLTSFYGNELDGYFTRARY